MKILRTLLIGLLLLAGGNSITWSGPFDDLLKRADAEIRLNRPLAEKGNAAAWHKVSRLYLEKSIMYYRAIALARKKNDYREVTRLTKRYDANKKAHENWEKAYLNWIEKAAENGNAEAQFEVGITYLNGTSYMPSNYATAFRLLTSAAEQGHAGAQYELGMMFYKGKGPQKNDAEALKWLQLAARNGYPIPHDLLPKKEGSQSSLSTSIPMKSEGGTYVVPVLINDVITLNFVVDSGATDVSIPADVVLTLMRTGTIKDSDFLGQKTYVMADGSKVPSRTFRIRSLKVANKVLENVTGSIASVKGELLLGQSFLGRFKLWSVDNNKHVLILE